MKLELSQFYSVSALVLMADEDHELTFEETLKGQIEELKKQIDDQESTAPANIKEDKQQAVMPMVSDQLAPQDAGLQLAVPVLHSQCS